MSLCINLNNTPQVQLPLLE